jgi:cytidyltransferase-like protein
VIGKFQPFNNGHLKLIKKANQTNGLPVVIMVVNGPKNFIKGEIMDKMMSIISNELPDVVDSYK